MNRALAEQPPPELLDVIYQYYPRGVGFVDGDIDERAISASEENARLEAARRKAATDERWHTLRRRIQEHFPDAPLMNHSLHLPTGVADACYSFTIDLPGAAKSRTLWFQVSFLVPYYIIHRSCSTDIVKERRTDFFLVTFRGLPFRVLRSPFDTALVSSLNDEWLKPVTITRHYVTFDLLPEERPYADWIAREIEKTFGCESMPPEVGTMLVPDLATPNLPGKVRVYDCLFSNNHEWVKPSPSDERARGVEVDAGHLTGPFAAVLTVLAALYVIMMTLMREAEAARQGGPVGMYWSGTTDGVLHKEEVLKVLAKIRELLDAPSTPRGIAAKPVLEAATRAFEPLIAAWNGEGAPPEAMVAWASNFLAHWCVDQALDDPDTGDTAR